MNQREAKRLAHLLAADWLAANRSSGCISTYVEENFDDVSNDKAEEIELLISRAFGTIIFQHRAKGTQSASGTGREVFIGMRCTYPWLGTERNVVITRIHGGMVTFVLDHDPGQSQRVPMSEFRANAEMIP